MTENRTFMRLLSSLQQAFARQSLLRQALLRQVLLGASAALLAANVLEHYAHAQTFAFGVLGGGSLLQHRASVPVLVYEPTCCQFQRGTSVGWDAALMGDLALVPSAPHLLQASLRLGYSRRPLALQERVTRLRWYDESTQETKPLLQDYTLSAALNYASVDAGLRLQPFATVPVYVRVGGDVQIPLDAAGSATASVVQDIAANGIPRFPDGSTKKIMSSAPLPAPEIVYGVNAAVGVSVPLADNLALMPELRYRMGLSSLFDPAQRTEWRTNSLSAALGLRWEFADAAFNDTAATAHTTEHHRHESLPPEAELSIEDLSSTPLEVQETVVTQTFPLLPYVFFDSASTVLHNKYTPRLLGKAGQEGKNTFQESALPKETLTIYYHLLHVVGKRMKSHPNAVLTLTGTTDGKEWQLPEQRKILARERARSVAAFLRAFWGIDERRVVVETRDVPQMASNPRYNEGNEENRRVELSCTVPAVLAPVIHSRFVEFAPSRTEQLISVYVRHPERARRYEATLEKDRIPLAAVQGTYRHDSTANAHTSQAHERLRLPLPERFEPRLASRIRQHDTLSCEVEITEQNGKRLRATTPVAVSKTQNAFEVSRLSLIVFDFDRAEMGEADKTLLKRFVQDAVIRPSSVAYITGTTDKLGEAAYNLELSQARANVVREHLQRIQPAITINSARGTGASVLPFDNTLPEGRYYCRTVSIVVRTPLDKP